MAFQFDTALHDAHAKPISALAYNPQKRECYTGGEDGLVKAWELENCRNVGTFAYHTGWVTELVYW